MPAFHRIAILGLGLIGSSLARAIRENMPDTHIAAFDTSHEALAFAARQNFADSQHAHAGQAAQDADMVILAAPPAAFATLASDMARCLKSGAIVTDVASVKRYAVANVAPHLPDSTFFVPGHPIAGSEKNGVAAGRADLFSGKRTILTPAEDAVMSEPVARVRRLWETIGARIEFMPADLHDRLYAYVSHLPQMVAFAARHSLQDLGAMPNEDMLRFSRLMKSEPSLWAEICLANADYVDAALADFAGFASQMEGELSEVPAASGVGAQQAAELFPRVVATCLIATASLLQEMTGVHPARYAGTGFADMTAPALSDPDAALEAISSHHWVIAKMLRELLARVQAIREALLSGDKAALIQRFQA